jgi:hypothetical protein
MTNPWLADLVGAVEDEDLMRRVDHPGHRLKARDGASLPARLPARLLDRLPHSSSLRRLVVFHDPTRGIPANLVRSEPVSPHQQHVVAGIIQDDRGGHRLEPHYVVPEPVAVGRFDLHLDEPNPRVVVEHPLPEHLRPRHTGIVFAHVVTLTR